jgi:NAD(P)-dependent dehydrogenase (short-subunit alcohol dehydrogenase family)
MAVISWHVTQMSNVRPVDESPLLVGPTLVTGAGAGIGLAVARLLSRSGNAVALLDRDSDRVGVAASELRASGGAVALALSCDVANEDELDSAFAEAQRELGPLAGVVASAGIDRGGPLHELPTATWDEVIGVNLRGTFLTCRAALRGMLGHGGSIVCVSSPLALVAPPGNAGAYVASKGGVSALVRALAVEYAPHGIRVNAVLPGPTETALMWAGVEPERVDEMRETIRKEVPLGRLADPEEPAQAVVWLLTNAASYVTGAQLACDGGVLAKSSVSV